MASGLVFGQGRPAGPFAPSFRGRTIPRPMASVGVATHPAAVPRALAGGVGDGVNVLVFAQDWEPLLPAADVVVGGAFRQVVPQQVQVVGMAVEPLDRLVDCRLSLCEST